MMPTGPGRALIAVTGIAMALSSYAASARAQSAGARVRVTVPYAIPSQTVGTVVSLTADTLALRPERDSALVFLPMARVARLDTSGGVHRHVLTGLGIGGASGLLLGGTIGLASGDDPPGDFISFTAGEKALILGGVLGAAGMVVGTAIGLVKSERWLPVALPRTAMTLEPMVRAGRTGLRFGLTLRPGARDPGR